MLVSKLRNYLEPLNNLKQVNDSLGHAAGDSMISNFARMLRLSVQLCCGKSTYIMLCGKCNHEGVV